MATPTGKSYKLRQCQVGKEAVWKTAVAATARLNLTDATLTLNAVSEGTQNMGTLAPSTDFDIMFVGATLEVQGTRYVEDAPFVWQAMMGESAPVGAGPYVRSYSAPHDASYSPVSYTFEVGIVGSAQNYKLSGALLTSYEENGTSREKVSYTATFAVGKIETMGALTALTTRTLTQLRYRDLTLKLDDMPSGTPGATTLAGHLRTYTLSIETGVHMKEFNGVTEAEGFGIGEWSGQVEMTLEQTATIDAIIASLVAGTKVQKYIQLVGSRSASLIDTWTMAGFLDASDLNLYEDADGNVANAYTFMALLDPINLATWFEAENTSTVAALPF